MVGVDYLVVDAASRPPERCSEAVRAKVADLAPVVRHPGVAEGIGDRLVVLMTDGVDRRVRICVVREALVGAGTAGGCACGRPLVRLVGVDDVLLVRVEEGAVVGTEDVRRALGADGVETRPDAVGRQEEEDVVEAAVPASRGQDGLDFALKLLVREAVRVDAVAAAVRGERILVDVRTPDRRGVLDVPGAVEVLGGYGIDVVRSAAVVRDVREVAVEQAFIVRVEGEARRLGGFGGGLRRCVSCRSRSAGVRYDAEDRCARGARSRARRRGGGERQRCEDEKRDRARGGSPHSSHRVPETDGNGRKLSGSSTRARPGRACGARPRTT